MYVLCDECRRFHDDDDHDDDNSELLASVGSKALMVKCISQTKDTKFSPPKPKKKLSKSEWHARRLIVLIIEGFMVDTM